MLLEVTIESEGAKLHLVTKTSIWRYYQLVLKQNMFPRVLLVEKLSVWILRMKLSIFLSLGGWERFGTKVDVTLCFHLYSKFFLWPTDKLWRKCSHSLNKACLVCLSIHVYVVCTCACVCVWCSLCGGCCRWMIDVDNIIYYCFPQFFHQDQISHWT